MSKDEESSRVNFSMKFGKEDATLGGAERSRSVSRRTASRTEADLSMSENPAAVEHDRVWQVLLVQLLGRLEFGRTSLENPTYRKDPSGAVRIASAMVSEVAQFISEQVDPQAYARPLADSLAAAGRFLSAAEVATGKSKSRGLFDFFKPRPVVNHDECMWILGDLPLVLERYFTMLGSCFKLSRTAMEWVDTSGFFLTELHRALNWVEGVDFNRNELRVTGPK